MAIYFFDKNQTLIKIVPESATFEAIQTQELDDDSLLKDTLSVTIKGDEKLIDAEYMAVKSYKGNAQTFDMYRIVTDTTPDKSMSFTGMSLAPYELNGHIIQDLRPANHSLSYTLNRVLDGTDWRVGYIEDGLSNVTTTFYYVSSKEALKELQSLVGCEFVFKVEISGQKITDKWIEVYSEMGNRTKKRFNYGTNALTVVRETNKADIYTALIGRGKGEEVSSGEDNASGQAGYGRKITFEDIEWKKSSGKPLDKPKGQYYLELPQATQVYGIKNIDGTMTARVGIVDFDDEEDKNRLINLTYQQLLVSSRPKILFKTTVANIGETGIGDTVTIHRHDLNIHYQTRVRKIVRNKLNDNKTQIELGDAVVTASTKRAKQNNATIKSLNQEIEKVKADVTVSQTSADGKNTINYGSAEPERQRTGDTWYRPHPSIAGETQMLVWNGMAWELVIDTSDLTSVSREVKNAIDSAEDAKALAVSEADSALTKAKADATAKANAIKEQITGEVNTAISTAEDAKALAISEAENTLALAKADATTKVNAIHEQISGEVNTAISTAEEAKALAVSEAESALALAKADATEKANAVKTEVSNSVNTAINTANDAKQTAIDNYNNAVAEAERLVDEQTIAFDTKFGEIEDSVDTVNQSVSDADAKAEAIKQGLGLSDITLTNQQITDQIMADYNTVKQNSTNALTDAGKALTDAYNAQQDANKAIEDFETFLTSDFASVENDITTAQTTATDALNKAGTAVSDLDTFKIDYNTFITDQFNPALTVATDALSLAEQNKGLFYSANLIDEVTGMSNVYTKSEIDGTTGYVTKATFKANADSISSELERVEGVALSSGANINLLIVKNAKNNTWLDTNPSSRTYPTPNDTTNATATSLDLISVTAGEKLTLSKTTVSGDNNFRIDFLNSSKAFVSRLAFGSNLQTITIPNNVAYMWVSYPMDSFPKVERGEIKTQWTLAPQDQVNQSTINYLTSKVEQTPELISDALVAYTPTDNLDDTVSSYLSNTTTKTAEAIDTKLTSYAKSDDLNGLATEEYASNKATETANGVKNELVKVIGTKVDSDTLDGYVSQATYDTGVEGISKSISTVEGKIPTAIGGRNLLRGTANFNTPLWRNVSTAIPSTRDSRYKQVRVDGDYTVAPITTMSTQKWNFEIGQDYVVSVYAKSEVLGNKLGLTAQSTIYFEPQVVAVSEWRRYVWKFKATISNLANFRFETRNGERVWITQPQVEKGTILTDWTLAPEDLQTIDALDANVVSLYNNTSSETSKAISRTLTAYTPTSELDNKTKNYLTSNQYQTAEMVTTTLNSYTPTDNLDGTVASYLKSSSSQTAGAIDTKLTSYAKTTDLNGLATETYATNKAVSEAGKVSSELTKYELKTGVDSKVSSMATSLREETAEGMKTVYTKSETNTLLGNKADSSALNNYVEQATYTSGIGGLSGNLTRVESKVDGMQIGGRNLLRGTADFDTYFWRNVSTSIPSSFDSRYKQVRVDGDFTVAPITTMETQGWNFEIGQEYTISVWAKSEVLGNKLGVTAQSTPYFEPQVVTLSKWSRYTWKFTATMSDLTNFRFETRNGERVWITQPQVEKGTIPTDWSPAVEDTLAKGEYNSFKATYDATVTGINSTLTALSNNKLDGTTYTNFHKNEYSKTAQDAKDAWTAVNKIVDEYGNTKDTFAKAVYEQNATRRTDEFTQVTNGLVKEATYTAGVNGINSSITTIKGRLDNLQVGGRNLLRGTADFNTDFWQNVQTAIPSTRDSRYKQVRVIGDFSVAPITTMATQGWNFEIGQEYVVSVYAKSEVSGNKIGLTAQSSAIYFEPQVVDVLEWRRFVWKFTATTSNLTSFRFETRNDEKVWITQPQIEKGSVPTDWTRAVEDLATVVQTNEIERTANYSKSAITNVTASGLVTGSTVNQTKDGITERVARLDTNGNVTYANREVKLDSIVSTVANDRYISNIIQTSDLVQSTIRENTNVDLLAKAASGTGMTADPNFNKGINGLTVYDSGNTNTISIYRNLTNDPNLPSGKGYRLDIYHASSTATSHQRGGVALPTRSWANGVVVVRFTARLDVGKNFVYHQNSTGTGSTHGWLTSNKGTGKWEQYTYYHRFGTSGTFQTFGFISVNATSTAFTWYLSDFDIINLGLSSQSQITQLQDNINLKVSKDGLISQFNLSAGNALIEVGTNKLNITPTTTYIEDATIKSAMIDSIDVKQIKGITADFTSMVTKGLTANVISSTMINANEALFDKLFSNTMATTKLVAQGAWITDANITSLDAGTITSGEIDTGRIKSGEVVAKGLVADVVKSTHIESSVSLIDKIFANEALITRLTSNTIFASKIKAIEIDASKITTGELAAARIKSKDVVTQGLTANVVKSTHIESSTGLIDKIFANEALITRLTSNSIFASKIKAIEIDASKIKTGTIDSGLIDAEYIVTNGLSTNVVESKHIKAEVGLVGKLFSKTAYIEELTNKTIFTEKIQAININADKITSGTLDAGEVKVINIDAENITSNKTSFIQSNWNDIESSIKIDGRGLLSTASDGSQVYLQNGVTGTRNPNGATIGQIGYAYQTDSPWYTMQTSYGSHFQIRMSRGAGELNKQAFYIISGGTESYLNTDNIYLNPSATGRVRVQGAMTVDKDLRVDGTIIVRSRLEYLNGGYIESQAANSNILINATNKLVIYTNGTNALEFDANNAVFRRKISDNSDIRLKTNIVDMPINSLEAIRNIEIKKFDYLDGRKDYYGIIAQQAQQYLPELINTDSNGYLMVDKSAMTYVNMHAIQQLNTKVDDEISQLKAQIASLQDELALLKGDRK